MLTKFIDHLKEEGVSKNTIQSYELNVKTYIEFIETQTDTTFKKLHRVNVQSYLKDLEKRVSVSSYNTYVNGLVKFNKFLVEKGIQKDIVITYKDKVKVQPSIEDPNKLTDKMVEKFRQEILNEGNYRNYAIVTVLAYMGLRISECLNIKMGDITFVSHEKKSGYMLINGKGDKLRKVYMGRKVYDAIKQYLPQRKSTSKDDYLFISGQGNRIDKSVINTYFNKRKANFTPHDLRHFFCSYAIKQNIYTLEQLASVAGHSNYSTTRLYIHHTEGDLLSAADKF